MAKKKPEIEIDKKLTQREKEILGIMLWWPGIRNGETARLLRVRQGTIKKHLSRIYVKLGIRDRHQFYMKYEKTRQ